MNLAVVFLGGLFWVWPTQAQDLPVDLKVKEVTSLGLDPGASASGDPSIEPKPFLKTTWVRLGLGERWETEAYLQNQSRTAGLGEFQPEKPLDEPSAAFETEKPDEFRMIGTLLRRRDPVGSYTEAGLELHADWTRARLIQGLELFSNSRLKLDAALGGAVTETPEESVVQPLLLLGAQASLGERLEFGAGLRTLGTACSTYASLELKLFDRYSVGIDCAYRLGGPSESDSAFKVGDSLIGDPDDGVRVQINLGVARF